MKAHFRPASTQIEDVFASDTRHGPWQKRLCTFFITITLILFCLFGFGCYLTPSIVTTEIEKTDKGFKLISPKDTSILYLKAPDGTTLIGYKATASDTALAAGSAESQARAAAIAKLAEAAAALK